MSEDAISLGKGFAHTLSHRVAKWSETTASTEPEFFERSAKGQSPKILWIGCADSRIPETTILGLKPGEVFVHRNIANIVTATDINSLSVIEFAVKHLKVEHILVCGHTSCGGVGAALGNNRLGLLDIWLQPMRQLRMEHSDELEKMDDKQKGLRLTQYNILRSLEVLRMNPTVIDAMNERNLELHGVIYDVASGKLEVVETSEDDHTQQKRLKAFTTA
ncbi:carbonic anhydrase [Delphinella strobiligena]|nr:carbonic anhydrase [Delphinella strobiligena]